MKLTYSEKLKDPRWQKKRLEVMQRDGFKCRDCGAKRKTLNVHHCYYSKAGPWATRADLLITVCEDCHEERQLLEDDARMMMAEMVSKTPDLAAFVASLSAACASTTEPLFLFTDTQAFKMADSK